MFDWMVWTAPVAIFFSCVALLLIGMTIWEIRSPTTLRKGWLPIATTRGDRLFIGLLTAAYLNLIWVGIGGWLAERLGLEEEPSVWIGTAVSFVVLIWIMRRG